MFQTYRKIIPMANRALHTWRTLAEKIPDIELKKQALASIHDKDFHCHGGAILSFLAKENQPDCLQFIVAYQTISDYLDNLCDRSTSLDPEDFAALHESLQHALRPEIDVTQINYYRLRDEQDDGGYLQQLVIACQNELRKTKHYSKIKEKLEALALVYCELQIYKHICVTKREARLTQWFDDYQATHAIPPLEWYEFSACAGSTLGIFTLVSYAFNDALSMQKIEEIEKGYFPYTQGLHILLDYFIDQEEDRLEGDLNFCAYYPSEEQMTKRLLHFIDKSNEYIVGIPNAKFHRMISHGLLGIYLSNPKARSNKEIRKLSKQFIKHAGGTAKFFYCNGRAYQLIKRMGKL